ncbi:Arc family DNA-binding protein [Paracoccus sp. DMF-8]|uniref:Arc family DNA-binding protein n=1 Tax=Paracoccus sp. DMF-8 TaxID=3019445 RepID=UPI0023E8672B|nr:Arc family DNA-binding protein [Paracoccus sp. DMF-8]MDF3606330.1 Arc family DNA-binding protein [Paracoccus sp. DMF-8]
MARPPASEQVQVNFRMPADLKARIEAAAEANSRTTTAELVATLEEKYPAPEIDELQVAHDALQRFLSAIRSGEDPDKPTPQIDQPGR